MIPVSQKEVFVTVFWNEFSRLERSVCIWQVCVSSEDKESDKSEYVYD